MSSRLKPWGANHRLVTRALRPALLPCGFGATEAGAGRRGMSQDTYPRSSEPSVT